jgi:large subunit ribosomal protein L25
MELQYITRPANKKSDAKKLRREGYIPAIIYARNKESETIAIKSSEFTALMRKVQPGRLSTTIFTLSGGNQGQRRAIIKDIDYKVTTYDVLHLDFEDLVEGRPINVKVPIECVGVADCVGVKLGNVIRQVIRRLKVRCLPKDIPSVFEIDVRAMGPRETRRLKDLSIPQTLRPLADLNEVAIAMVKR